MRHNWTLTDISKIQYVVLCIPWSGIEARTNQIVWTFTLDYITSNDDHTYKYCLLLMIEGGLKNKVVDEGKRKLINSIVF